MNTEQEAQLTHFFKLVGHETRLKILGLLANKAQTAVSLAATLDEKEKDILTHLRLLLRERLVSTATSSGQTQYRLNPSRFDVLRQQVESSLFMSQEEAVMKQFVQNGRLITMPSTYEERTIILDWLANKFEIHRRYSLAEVQAIMAQHSRTPLSALRHLRDRRLLLTVRGIYWRPDPNEERAR